MVDVARMLLSPPAALENDIPKPVLEVPPSSAEPHVSIIGQRGPLQAAFTNKELREPTFLDGASMRSLALELLAHPLDMKITPRQLCSRSAVFQTHTRN